MESLLVVAGLLLVLFMVVVLMVPRTRRSLGRLAAEGERRPEEPAAGEAVGRTA